MSMITEENTPQEIVALLAKVKEMRDCQRSFRKSLIKAWDNRAQLLEKEVDEMIEKII